ncbi:MAG: hypothetical protein ACFBSF_01225 [Leptolyngbyaceae cyanobacterium]
MDSQESINKVDTYADNQGLFVMQQSGNSVVISNAPSFSPGIW